MSWNIDTSKVNCVPLENVKDRDESLYPNIVYIIPGFVMVAIAIKPPLLNVKGYAWLIVYTIEL